MQISSAETNEHCFLQHIPYPEAHVIGAEDIAQWKDSTTAAIEAS